MSGNTSRVRVSGSLSLNDIELENIHVEIVELIEALTAMAVTRPNTGVFSGEFEYNGAEESLWDSLSTPSKSLHLLHLRRVVFSNAVGQFSPGITASHH